jgi:hypothetical protein
VVLAILLLLGLYFFENTIVRILCGIGLLAWTIAYTSMVVIKKSWPELFFPGLVLLLALLMRDIKRFTQNS